MCQTYYNEEHKLKAQIKEKDDLISSLKQMSDNVVSKNVSLDNENKRLKLALKQSEHEKSKLKQEIVEHRESLNTALKENVVLNETIKLKENIQKESRGQEDVVESREDSEVIEDTTDDSDENPEEIEVNKDGAKESCKECDFKPSVPIHIKGHNLKHTGQFMCQRGCKSSFKTFRELDQHVKTMHVQQNSCVDYKCDKCEQTFNAIYKLRLHTARAHVGQKNVTCENCEQNFTNLQQLKIHMDRCDSGFTQVNRKICRYFANGYCWNINCRFSHPQNVSQTPVCRNGSTCRYLANGCCTFFHTGVGVQNPRNQYSKPQHPNNHQNQTKKNGSSRGWCRYMEECNRVPSCPFTHYEEDFPPLGRNNPPESLKSKANIQGWQDY